MRCFTANNMRGRQSNHRPGGWVRGTDAALRFLLAGLCTIELTLMPATPNPGEAISPELEEFIFSPDQFKTEDIPRELQPELIAKYVQVRITRLVIAAGQPVDVRTTPQEPALLIALTPGRIEGEPGASQAATSFTPGQELWIATAASRRLHNAGAAPLELLRFDFKTPPLAAR